MLGELFTPTETPEAQNRGFLKGFFGGNANTFDREELCVFSIFLFYLYENFHSSVQLSTQKMSQLIKKYVEGSVQLG